ncbi:hypothetical protein COCNU_03G005610 [Cocos nucifera]|uniref:Uncharacterized protein n=1 Tax=Cocos nucifera TaxID=13894 RepID=A0A8K0I236_COCNU|nr:hypothetical protein COCNU_03G005610 [Cocos nucifera]
MLSKLASSHRLLGPLLVSLIVETQQDPTCFPLPLQLCQMAIIVVTFGPREEEKDSAIRLVHLLMSCVDAIQCSDSGLAGTITEEMSCANTVQHGDSSLAGTIIEEMNYTDVIQRVNSGLVGTIIEEMWIVVTHVNTDFGIRKLLP